MIKKTKKNLRGNQKGFITVDYLIAIVLVSGFSAILFSMAMTLTVVEVTQYVTFAAARTLFAGHVSPDTQAQLALNKYQQLTNHPTIAPLYRGGWFEISNEPMVGNISEQYQQVIQLEEGEKNLFWGVGTSFKAKILDFQIPMFGSTAPDDDGQGSGFTTFVASYVGREPSFQECLAFTNKRWELIRERLNPTMNNQIPSTADYSVDDNGC